MEKSIFQKDIKKIKELGAYLSTKRVPKVDETASHSFVNTENKLTIQNKYFFIVAICHQTSPLGERPLCGYINGELKKGWDYLKEKVLTYKGELDLSSHKTWLKLTPNQLSSIFFDQKIGKTLNRISERTFLINDLGKVFLKQGFKNIVDIYSPYDSVYSNNGLLTRFGQFEAYSDPVFKKTFFFLSLMKSIFGWTYQENEILKSPVDYHELRGHLRIGTVKINDEVLSKKMKLNLPITEEEDTALRKVVQSVNDDLSTNIGLSPDQLHYLLWNIFRACCPSNSKSTHCYQCDQKCTLPKRYAGLNEDNKCLFSEICDSAALDNKIKEPAYFGHFY